MTIIRRNAKALSTLTGGVAAVLTQYAAGNVYASLGVAILTATTTWLISNTPSKGQ